MLNLQPKTFRLVIALICFFAMERSASAEPAMTISDSTLTPHVGPAPWGGYCSATTSLGVWAFAFGPQNAEYQCAVARNALARYTSAPINNWSSGYYSLNGYNRVLMHCAYNVLYFDGYGTQILQNTYGYAVSIGDSFCSFSVQ